MANKLKITVFLFLLVACKPIDEQPIADGSYRFTLMFSEFMSRDNDVPCDVIIDGLKIIIQQNQDTGLPGARIICEGTLSKHDSGKWIISDNEADKHALEIGGCTGIIVVDFEKKVVVWC